MVLYLQPRKRATKHGNILQKPVPFVLKSDADKEKIILSSKNWHHFVPISQLFSIYKWFISSGFLNGGKIVFKFKGNKNACNHDTAWAA